MQESYDTILMFLFQKFDESIDNRMIGIDYVTNFKNRSFVRCYLCYTLSISK